MMEWLFLCSVLCLVASVARTVYQIDMTNERVREIREWMADDCPAQPSARWRIVPRGKKDRY